MRIPDVTVLAYGNGILHSLLFECYLYTLRLKNRTFVIFSNISNKPGPILIISDTENRE